MYTLCHCFNVFNSRFVCNWFCDQKNCPFIICFMALPRYASNVVFFWQKNCFLYPHCIAAWPYTAPQPVRYLMPLYHFPALSLLHSFRYTKTLEIHMCYFQNFLAVQDSSITDIVCPLVCLSVPTNNQSLVRAEQSRAEQTLQWHYSDTTVTAI